MQHHTKFGCCNRAAILLKEKNPHYHDYLGGTGILIFKKYVNTFAFFRAQSCCVVSLVFSLVNCFSESLHMHHNTMKSRRHTSYGTSFKSLGNREKNNLINIPFFCFSWVHQPIRDSTPGCLLFWYKYCFRALISPSIPALAWRGELGRRVFQVVLCILGRILSSYCVKGMVPYAYKTRKHSCN